MAAEPFKRPWNATAGENQFEVAHVDGPAANMDIFHWHDYLELSYIKDGSGRYEIEDKTFDVSKGDVVIINNIEKHRVTYGSDGALYETVIHFHPGLIWSGDGLTGDFKYLNLFRYNETAFMNRPELMPEAKAELQALFASIEAEYRGQKPFFELMIKSRLLTIIALLLRECGGKAGGEGSAGDTRKGRIERLEKILLYIKDNSGKDLGLDEAAGQFAMNPSYFSEYFKKNIGVNYSDYLSKLRVQHAIRLLNDTDASVTDISYAAGFNNTTSFYNAFKKITGMNPRDYMKKNKPTEPV